MPKVPAQTSASAAGLPDAEPATLSRTQINRVMVGLLISLLLAQLDNMIVVPAMPTIVGELRGLPYLAWVITGYTLTMTVATPIWGKLGDLFGRKRVFLASIAVFVIGSALCGIAQDMPQLIAFGAFQGIGAGGLVVGVPAIIGELVPQQDRGRYTSLMMAMMPLAMIGGPMVGGVITDHLTWRLAFYVNVPLGLVAFVVVWSMMRIPAAARRSVRIDWSGVALLTIWISAAMLVVTWSGEYSWTSARVLVVSAIAAVGFIVFLLVERSAVEPIMPLALFRNRDFALSGVLTFSVGFGMFGSLTYLPQFQQLAQGATASNSGLLLLPMLIAVLASNLAVGQLRTKTPQYRLYSIMGMGFMGVGMFLNTFLEVGTSRLAASLFMVVLGIGIGLLLQPTLTIAQNSVTLKDMGAAMGASTFLRNMGSSLGVSIMGSLYISQLRNELTDRLGEQGRELVSSGSQLPPSVVHQLPNDIHNVLATAVAHGVQRVFWLCVGMSVIGFALSLFLRKPAAVGAAAAAAPATAGTSE